MDEQRQIIHMDLDSFFVSVERLKNSSLNGKPVIVGGAERGVVAACSYEARTFGVRSAMPMRQARFLCPDAIIISGDHEDYGRHSKLVTDVIADSVPIYEKASIDEFYADLTGMDRFFGTAMFSAELKKKITKETGLPISYGLASNKLLGKVATNEVKPNGQIEIPFGSEKNYLAPLAIQKMPMVGTKTATLLRDMGVSTIKILSEIPQEMLIRLLGKNGRTLSRRASGIDDTPVIPYTEQKSISTEDTFFTDTMDMDFLQSKLVRMIEKISFELRQQKKMTGCITVKLRYADFNTVTKGCRIPYTASDHVLLETAAKLLRKLYDRRLLVRLLGIRFTDLVTGAHQISLFDDTQEMISLYQQIDSIKNRFGPMSLIRASGVYPLSVTKHK
ncbi:MAG TPA: DNA polymerase IV [Arachidicoccus sp.]|nr:DNA polymerase IV [Arachidicoccus sp.]